MSQKEDTLQSINATLETVRKYKNDAIKLGAQQVYTDLCDSISSEIKRIRTIVEIKRLSNNYYIQFHHQLSNIGIAFQDQYVRQTPGKTYTQEEQLEIKISNSYQIKELIKELDFNFVFFQSLDFFQNNVVIVGANGSGKTSLSTNLKNYLPENGLVISAQKVLVIPTFTSISTVKTTAQNLKAVQTADKTLKVTYQASNGFNSSSVLYNTSEEFKCLLDNLIAERNVVINKFYTDSKHGVRPDSIPSSKLDVALLIWNSLITHRNLECNDGTNLILTGKDISSYPAYQMSDGEKVLLYYVAHVLQAPRSGFIIIDEPEMYLHKTILQKIWDILESERKDCIFIYLTHDLDFASSRTAKKVWIRSYSYPSQWTIDAIPDNELPEPLLLELLGSRKNILFCEGTKGGIDERLYNILFPQFTVTPVENCFAVIYYTKAFNKISNLNTKALGLIDSDHQDSDRLQSIARESIYSFAMAEIENLLLSENFLTVFSKQLLQDENVVEEIKKDIFSQFKQEINTQIANYISTKINFYFKDSHIAKGNTLESVKLNFAKFIDSVKIDGWSIERGEKLRSLLEEKIMMVF